MNILYEDDNIIAVVKMPGEPSQPDKTGDRDLASMLKDYTGGDIFVVHRLDRPVGGVMVYAKNGTSAARLSEEFKNPLTGKNYLAVVNGMPEKNDCDLTDYIFTDKRKNVSLVVSPKTKGAKEARLHYEVIEYNEENNLSLLNIKLFTGRHHQIRVQLSAMGTPIWGDIKYNKNFKKAKTLPALWSYSISGWITDKGAAEFKAYPEQYPFNIFKNFKKNIEINKL